LGAGQWRVYVPGEPFQGTNSGLYLYILSVYNIHMKKVRVNVLLGKDQLTALKKKTDKDGTNVSLVLRQLIDAYLRGTK
jgi:hypothetical protein